jgi:ABC-type taurine transport system substrate-binding protein
VFLPVHSNLFRSISDYFIESEIGQADKHVLKNPTRIERFMQVIRKTLEEELVSLNFHALLMAFKVQIPSKQVIV